MGHEDEKYEVKFQMRIIGSFKLALSKQIYEGVRIKEKYKGTVEFKG